jgi:hypothetical protein
LPHPQRQKTLSSPLNSAYKNLPSVRAITGEKKRAMLKEEDDFKTTIMKGLELRKQELLHRPLTV